MRVGCGVFAAAAGVVAGAFVAAGVVAGRVPAVAAFAAARGEAVLFVADHSGDGSNSVGRMMLSRWSADGFGFKVEACS